MKNCRLLATLCLAWCACLARANDTRVDVSVGAQYSSGEYGETTSTEALVIPLRIRATHGGWMFQASLPFVTASGPANLGDVFDDDGGHGSNSGSGSGSGSGPSGGGDDGGGGIPAATDQDASGPGDATLTAGYSFGQIADTPIYLDLRARARLPTGSRRDGLGSGATDYALSSEIGVDAHLGGLYLNVGRRFLGQAGTTERVDGWQASGGAWWNAGPRATLGVSYGWRDATTRAGVAPRFVEAWISWQLARTWRLELNVGSGLSDASPERTVGFTLTRRLGGRARSRQSTAQ